VQECKSAQKLTAVGDKPRRYIRHFTVALSFASRYSPFVAVLARQEPRPPNFRVPCPA